MKNPKIATLLGFALTFGSAAMAAEPAPVITAPGLLADRLLNDARIVARANLPPALATRHATILLQSARTVAPDSLDVLRALAEAAGASRDQATLKDVLKQIVRLDPGDLAAQVQLIGVLAESAPTGGEQTVEEQMRVYAAALEKESLDPQVRSEIATVLARLYLQRGRSAEAHSLLERAVKLNDVNYQAWQELIALQTTGPVRVSDRMNSIVSCLAANPFLPHVWVAGARALGATNQHDLAADFLAMGIDAGGRAGTPMEGRILLEWAIESATADRRADAETALKRLAALPDAPLEALLAALSVMGPSATTQASDPLADKIRERISDAVKAAPKDKAARAEAAWVELLYLPTVGLDATGYIDGYKELAGEKDEIYQRLRGWQLLRAGKMADAAQILAPLAAKDALANLGMARIDFASGEVAKGRDRLQEIWSGHPVGLLALHTATEARKNKVALKDTALGQSVRATALAMRRYVFSAIVQPRDMDLLMPTLAKRRYAPGEPVVLTVKVANTADRALSVGPHAAVKSTLAISGALSGTRAQSLGFYAFDNYARVYRLPARSQYTQTIRLDQGQVYELLMLNPLRSLTISTTLLTDPQAGRNGLVPGLGGQVVGAGEFVREPLVLGKLEDAEKLATALPTAPPEQQMLTGLALSQAVTEMTDRILDDRRAGASAKLVRTKITDALVKVIDAGSPVLQAWFLRMSPIKDLPPACETALERAPRGKDPLVRMANCTRTALKLRSAGAADKAILLANLQAIAAGDEEAQVKQLAQIVLEEAAQPAMPASQPLTQPATRP